MSLRANFMFVNFKYVIITFDPTKYLYFYFKGQIFFITQFVRPAIVDSDKRYINGKFDKL